jgi:uncharacterized protein
LIGSIMKVMHLVTRSKIPADAAELFAWHERPGALARLTPPWEPVRVVSQEGTIHDGDRTVLELPVGPLSMKWEAVHSGYHAGREFSDEQVRGPFALWKHTHRVTPGTDGQSVYEDDLQYATPLGALGRAFGGAWVRRRLERMFVYRHHKLGLDLARHRLLGRRLRIAVSGASGLVGTQLCAFLETGGHEVLRLVRSKAPGPSEIAWNPRTGTIDAAKLEGLDAVVHLAGENVGARWSAARKQRIVDSREQGTRLLAETLAHLQRPPRVWVSASAVGIYGYRGGEFDETGAPADDFLATVCQKWEAATEPAIRAGLRVVHSRFGVILTPSGGALGKLLLPFRMGVGGRIGNGRQVMSWIAIDDAIYAIHHAIANETLSGPINVVSPAAVTNAELTRALGRVLSRPTLFPVPAPIIKLALGEMGKSALLGGATVRPRRLLESGFRFAHPELEDALRFLLGRQPIAEAWEGDTCVVSP